MTVRYSCKLLDFLALEKPDSSIEDLDELLTVVDNIVSCQEMMNRKSSTIGELCAEGKLIGRRLFESIKS